MSVWSPWFFPNGIATENPPQLSVSQDLGQQPRIVRPIIADEKTESPTQFFYHGQNIPMSNVGPVGVNPFLMPSVPLNYPLYQIYYWPHIQNTAQTTSQNPPQTTSHYPHQATPHHPPQTASQTPPPAASHYPPQAASQSPPQTTSKNPRQAAPQNHPQTVAKPPENKLRVLKRKYNIKKCAVLLSRISETEIRRHHHRPSSHSLPFTTKKHTNIKMSQGTSLKTPVKLHVVKSFSINNEFVALPSTNKAPWKQHAMEKLSKSYTRPPHACTPPQEQTRKSNHIFTNVSGSVGVERRRKPLTMAVREGDLPPNEIFNPLSYKIFKSSQRAWSSKQTRSEWHSPTNQRQPMYMPYIGRPTEGFHSHFPLAKRGRGRPRKTDITQQNPTVQLPKLVITADDDSLFNAVIKKAQEAQTRIYRKPERSYSSAASTPSTLSASETEMMMTELEMDSDSLTDDAIDDTPTKESPPSWQNKIVGEDVKKIDCREWETGVGEDVQIIYNQEQQPLCEREEELFNDSEDWEQMLGNVNITEMLTQIIDEDFYPDIPDIQKLTEDDPQPSIEQEVNSHTVTTEIESEACQKTGEESPGTSSDIIFINEFESEPQSNTDILIINAEDEELPLPSP